MSIYPISANLDFLLLFNLRWLPSVVNKFTQTRNLREVCDEQQNIIHQYKADFIKYENDYKKLKIISIFDSIPAQFNEQNRRFIFTQLNKELKFERYENSFFG